MPIELQGSLIILHGPPKVGKTQLADSFESPVLFVASEPGHRYVKSEHKETVFDISDSRKGWEKFKDGFLSHMKKVQPKTVVFDVASGLYYAALQHVCEKNRWAHPEEGGKGGRGWAFVRREFVQGFEPCLIRCAKLKRTLVFIDHTKLEGEGLTKRASLAMPGQLQSILEPIADHIWFMGYDQDEGKDAVKKQDEGRCLWLLGTELTAAGTRDPDVTKLLKSRNTTRIRNIPMEGQYQYILSQLNKGKSKQEKEKAREQEE